VLLQLQALSSGIKQQAGGGCEQCVGRKSWDNIGEERHRAESGLMRYQARKGTPKGGDCDSICLRQTQEAVNAMF